MTPKEFRIQRALGTIKFSWRWSGAGYYNIHINREEVDLKIDFESTIGMSVDQLKNFILDKVEEVLP